MNQSEIGEKWQVISKLHEEFLTLKEEEVANSTLQPQNIDQGSQKLFGKGNRLMILYSNKVVKGSFHQSDSSTTGNYSHCINLSKQLLSRLCEEELGSGQAEQKPATLSVTANIDKLRDHFIKLTGFITNFSFIISEELNETTFSNNSLKLFLLAISLQEKAEELRK